MSKKIRKKKKYSVQKQIQRLTKGFEIQTRESWRENGQMIARGFLNGRQVGTAIYDKANSISRDWQITVFYECQHPSGEIYIEESEIIARNIFLNDITDFFKQVKRQTYDAVNHKHIVDSGFTATVIN